MSTTQKVNSVNNAKPSAFCFNVKTKILVDVHIFISLPLRSNLYTISYKSNYGQASRHKFA